ncbi:hypothetical protein V1511DRAFT_460539 [Dipodascopsis uninucleata]
MRDALLPKGRTDKSKRKRAYKACLNCRKRKAKCIFPPDMAFIPPCIRCQREGCECRFVPSRRGGRRVKKSSTEEARDPREPAQIESNNPENENNLTASDSRLADKEANVNNGDQFEYHENIHGHQTQEKKIDAHESTQVDTETLAFSMMRNPSDAISLLTQASLYSSKKNGYYTQDDEDDEEESSAHSDDDSAEKSVMGDGLDDAQIRSRARLSVYPSKKLKRTPLEKIAAFPLIKKGYINPTQLRTYVSIYFTRHNHYLPLMPLAHIPKNDEMLSDFAEREPFLLIAMIIVASRFENCAVHEACWKYMQTIISDLMFGTEPTVGAVEALMLLSENIPRFPHVEQSQIHYYEERTMWNLIGLAIRISYYLGLDQKGLGTLDSSSHYNRHRERLVWTHCYILDRQASIRVGKAFWSRGPSLCFQNPSRGASALNFPTLVPKNIGDEDYASFMQAQIELTQILTNIHDTLYPSRDRTLQLVQGGEYPRILDEYSLTFASHKMAWQQVTWKTFPLNEIVWLSYHYACLYAYGFSFQSHLRRCTAKYKEMQQMPSEDRMSLAEIVFPRGMAGSPDARYIIEFKKAAMDLLTICVDQLHAGGALAYLPARFYGYISYAIMCLIKVVFTGAVLPNEQNVILSLINRVTTAIFSLEASVDNQNPLLRRISQLKFLIKTLWNAEGGIITSQRQLDTTNINIISEPKTDSRTVNVSSSKVDPHDLAASAWQANNSLQSNGFNTEIQEVFPFTDIETGNSDLADAGLASMLSFDLDSEIWLSYFYNQDSYPMVGE